MNKWKWKINKTRNFVYGSRLPPCTKYRNSVDWVSFYRFQRLFSSILWWSFESQMNFSTIYMSGLIVASTLDMCLKIFWGTASRRFFWKFGWSTKCFSMLLPCDRASTLPSARAFAPASSSLSRNSLGMKNTRSAPSLRTRSPGTSVGKKGFLEINPLFVKNPLLKGIYLK